MSALHTLVVDDSASARIVLKRLLERKGLQVDQSESGMQALDYLKTHKPDLIFMDHSMPGMSGLDAMRAMREDPTTASIPVVMYTSQNDEGYVQEALASGALDIISKPANWNKLSQVIDSVANREVMTDAIAASIDQQLSSLRDHLAFTMEQQIQRVCDELTIQFEQRLRTVESRQQSPSPYPNQGLSTLIHSITDSKLHQLNMELRHHLSAKMDVLAQDLLQQQNQQKQELLLGLEEHLRKLRASNRPHWWLKLPQLVRQKWYVMPFWSALLLMAAMLTYWSW